MKTRIAWSRDQLLVAFRLYCRTPFGRLHQHNPEIVDLAKGLGRTPSAVAMKACNFASLDPAQRTRNVAALRNASRSDRELWNAFHDNPEAIAAEAEAAYAQLTESDARRHQASLSIPDGPTEITRTVRARRVQGFFRDAVLASYEYRCAISEIAVPELLNASHIIPWRLNTQRRADPSNGIALNALYDRAFDRGLIAFDEKFRVMVSGELRNSDAPTLHQVALLDIEGQMLRLPRRFLPDPAALAYHREYIYARRPRHAATTPPTCAASPPF